MPKKIADMKTPIRYVGLSTHRRIHPEAIDRVEAAAKELLLALLDKSREDGRTLVMLNSLAEGGDTILARLAVELSIPYIAILPRPLTSYAEDFEGEAQKELFALCDKAREVRISPDIEGEGRSDYDYLYRQAGIYVAAKSDVFIALWDGVPGKPDGCGAAEAYAFAKSACYADPNGDYPLKPRTLYHILTPRPTQTPENAGKVRKETVEP